ncbi:hypothetical protein Syun_015375 [Stephania yunnanensis]|uniref:Uncharacterized protein n=1 Tax=Stephania yunnanensis TaxID=152371 RepID=A0AAP0PCV8_9MAGN
MTVGETGRWKETTVERDGAVERGQERGREREVEGGRKKGAVERGERKWASRIILNKQVVMTIMNAFHEKGVKADRLYGDRRHRFEEFELDVVRELLVGSLESGDRLEALICYAIYLKGKYHALRVEVITGPNRHAEISRLIFQKKAKVSLAFLLCEGHANSMYAEALSWHKLFHSMTIATIRIASTVKANVDERIGYGEVSNKQGDFLQILLSANTLSDNEKLSFVDRFREITRIASTVKAIVDERIGNGEVSNKQGDFLQILLYANTLSDNEK